MMEYRAQLLGGILIMTTAFGCGATTQPPTHEDFAIMQVLESRTFEAANVATDESRSCAERAPALDRCDHARDRLCLVSEGLDDQDSAYWCEGAGSRCREARTWWQARCEGSSEGESQ